MKHDCFYFVTDLETGGFWPHQNPVIEVAIVVLNQNLEVVEEYENYIKPYDNLVVTDSALAANGINMKDVMEKGITIDQFWKDFTALAKKYKMGRYNKPVLAGHNITSFDRMFFEFIADKFEPRTLPYTSKLYSYFDSYIEDTMWTSRKKWGHIEVNDHKLGSVAERYGVVLTDAHRALNDTRATAQIFVQSVKELRDGKTVTNGENNASFVRKFQF